MGKTLIVPGLNGSGPGHWQHWWLRNDRDAVLVEQDDWRRPCPEAWAARLRAAVEAHPGAMLVAHSLGVPLVTRLAAERRDLRVAGALLVAPADVEEMGASSDRLRGFAPMSLAPLPFPATVVASRTDRCMDFRRARAFAAAWGAELVDYGDAGHINAASGFGPWPDGPRLLAEVEARRRHVAAIIHLQPRPAPSPPPGRRRGQVVAMISSLVIEPGTMVIGTRSSPMRRPVRAATSGPGPLLSVPAPMTSTPISGSDLTWAITASTLSPSRMASVGVMPSRFSMRSLNS